MFLSHKGLPEILAAAALLAAAVPALPQTAPSPTVSPTVLPTPSPSPLAPRIQFEETSHNAGQVWEGDMVSHVFKFRNVGQATLHVSRVRTSCGCTAALVSKQTVEPGEEGEVKAEFNTRNYRGIQRKTVYVSSDDPITPTQQLQLEVEVKSAGSLSPRSLAFQHVTFGEQTTRTIQLIPEEKPFKVTEARAEPEVFQAKIPEWRTETGQEKAPIVIEVTFGPAPSVGGHSGTLIVKTDHPRLPELRAPLSATVEGLVQYSPRMLLFTREDLEKGTVKKVSFTHRRGEEFAVTSAECSVPQFTVGIEPSPPGAKCELSIQLSPGLAPGRYRGLAIVRTDQPGQEEIKIPLTANIQK